MITPSDITITVFKDPKAYKPNSIVQAELILTEVVTAYREEEGYIDLAKEKVRHNILHRLYGDLRDSIEELYATAMMKMPYGPEMEKMSELKGQIDKIMRGET